MMQVRVNRDQGLTLVELIVVIAVMGLICAISASSFSLSRWLSIHQLKKSSRELYLNMQKARSNAVKENRDWAILFDPANSRYSLQVKNGSVWIHQGDSISLPANVSFGYGLAPFDATEAREPLDPINPSSPITFTGKRATFNPLGLPSKSGYCYLANESGEAYAIGSNSVGTIKLKRWSGDDWE
jgi:prepilin-type N-terminal cleavage/methylation domain-containing protein